MNDKTPLLPALQTTPTDHPDYVVIRNLIQARGLASTLLLAAQYCERRIAEATHNKNQAGKTAWLKRYDAIRICALTVDNTPQIR